jgi:spermidine/putrescine transport system substrate-binding protein
MNRFSLRRAVHSQRVTRRGFLQLGGAAATAAFLAACGGQTNVAPAMTPTVAPVAPTALPTSAPTAMSAAARELFLYNWSDYIAPETVESFQKDLKATLVQDYYASNEDLLAKIEAGGVGYDVVVPSEYMVQIMAERDLLLPLDWSRIPNTQYISPPFDKGRPHDPDNQWSVPKNWGTFGIMWNTDQVPDEFTSWADLWRLASKYSGKIVLVDSAPEVFGAALKLLGYSYNSTDPKEIDAALEKLVELKPHVRSFESNQGGMFVTGEAVLGMGWNGDAASANAQRKEAGGSETIVYAVPSEGSLLWEDDWAILKTAPHPELALEFINYVIEPQRQAAETNYSYYGSPQEQAKKYINPDVLADPAVYPSAEVMARLEPAKSLPDEALQYREEAWTKLKSA